MNKRVDIIKKCKSKLIQLKYKYTDTLAKPTLYQRESGEVIDNATSELYIQDSTFFRNRIKSILPEIHNALDRIEQGTYGYCEVTGNEIESKRLLAVPWARISMEAYQSEMAS